jgi:hypothetical protein
MGAYLHIGFVVEATGQLSKGITKEQFLKAIEAYYPPDLFNCKESEGEITLTLKSSVIDIDVVPFLEQISVDYFGKVGVEQFEGALKFMKKNLGKPDWLEIEADDDYDASYNFMELDHWDCDEFEVNGMKLYLNPSIFLVGSEGKFLMEDSDNTLRFMKNCALRAYSDFRLGNTFRLTVM